MKLPDAVLASAALLLLLGAAAVAATDTSRISPGIYCGSSEESSGVVTVSDRTFFLNSMHNTLADSCFITGTYALGPQTSGSSNQAVTTFVSSSTCGDDILAITYDRAAQKLTFTVTGGAEVMLSHSECAGWALPASQGAYCADAFDGGAGKQSVAIQPNLVFAWTVRGPSSVTRIGQESCRIVGVYRRTSDSIISSVMSSTCTERLQVTGISYDRASDQFSISATVDSTFVTRTFAPGQCRAATIPSATYCGRITAPVPASVYVRIEGSAFTFAALLNAVAPGLESCTSNGAYSVVAGNRIVPAIVHSSCTNLGVQEINWASSTGTITLSATVTGAGTTTVELSEANCASHFIADDPQLCGISTGSTGGQTTVLATIEGPLATVSSLGGDFTLNAKFLYSLIPPASGGGSTVQDIATAIIYSDPRATSAVTGATWDAERGILMLTVQSGSGTVTRTVTTSLSANGCGSSLPPEAFTTFCGTTESSTEGITFAITTTITSGNVFRFSFFPASTSAASSLANGCVAFGLYRHEPSTNQLRFVVTQSSCPTWIDVQTVSMDPLAPSMRVQGRITFASRNRALDVTLEPGTCAQRNQRQAIAPLPLTVTGRLWGAEVTLTLDPERATFSWAMGPSADSGACVISGQYAAITDGAASGATSAVPLASFAQLRSSCGSDIFLERIVADITVPAPPQLALRRSIATQATTGASSETTISNARVVGTFSGGPLAVSVDGASPNPSGGGEGSGDSKKKNVVPIAVGVVVAILIVGALIFVATRSRAGTGTKQGNDYAMMNNGV